MLCSVSLLVIGGTAGAGTGVGASGNTVPGAAAPETPYTASTPFDSGQGIDVVIPPNSVLTPGANIYVLECAAPSGAVPTTISQCDGETQYGGTITVQPNGSVDVVSTSSDEGNPYTVYALPDHYSLGESPSSPVTCSNTAGTECVLYIGQGGGQDTGLTQPHFFSQPFEVNADPTDSGTINPGDGGVDAFAAPSITSAASKSFIRSTTFDVTADAAAYPPPTFTETGTLPGGVTFNSATGVLSGAPTQAGTFPITFSATNWAGTSAIQHFTLTVPFQITTTSLPNATIGHSYTGAALHEIGGTPPIKWKKVSGLPKGLAVNSASGAITGTPSTKAVSANVTFSAEQKVNKVATIVMDTVHITVNP